MSIITTINGKNMLLKTSKRYVINSNRVNNPGFRLLSEGVDQTDYDNNPLLIWMHYRPTGASKDEVLPVGIVKDIQIDANGVMTGQPYFDGDDPFAKQLFDKYESGVLNMFSICAQPIEISDDPADMLPGQTLPTIVKSKLKEISAVDIGGNPDAYGVMLCDDLGAEVKLADLKPTKFNQTNMKLTSIAVAGLLPLIKLSDTATEAEAIAKLTELVQLADPNYTELVQLRDYKKTTEPKVTELETKLTEAVKLKDAAEMSALKEQAVNVHKKVTVAQFDKLAASMDFVKLKDYLATEPANPTIQQTMHQQASNTTEVEKLVKLGWDELHKTGKLEKLKQLDEPAFIKLKDEWVASKK